MRSIVRDRAMIWETHGTVLAAFITVVLVLVLMAIIAGVAWLRRGPGLSHRPHIGVGRRTAGMTGQPRVTDIVPPVRREAAMDRVPAAAPPPPTPNGRSAAPSVSGTEIDLSRPVFSPLRPETALSPRFGDGSEAARLPWLLPEEQAAPSGVAADQAVLGALTVRAASVVGPGNRCERPARPRQDAYRIAQDSAAAHLIVAVADGMSDSARAEFGAMVAVGKAVGLVRNRLDRGERVDDLRARGLFADVAAGILAAAEERGLGAEDVRTTLTVAVIPAGSALVPRTAWVGHVADTTVWLRDTCSWHRVTANVKEPFDGNALRTFMPHHPDAALSHTFPVTAGATVAVFSDGVADSFDEVPGAAEWFAERWRDPPPLASFVLDIDFDAKAQHDDRTAVVVWCDREPGRGDRHADA